VALRGGAGAPLRAVQQTIVPATGLRGYDLPGSRFLQKLIAIQPTLGKLLLEKRPQRFIEPRLESSITISEGHYSMSKFPGLFARIKRVMGGLGFILSPRQTAGVAGELAKELERAPRIALLGETGVGKSSTLNALFNAGAPIDHIRPCTVEPSEYAIVTEIEGSHGPVRVFDMPGLGQDLQSDEAFVKEYARILPTCDVALWILDGCTRTLSQTQASLRGVVSSAMSGLDRLVIGVNKIDAIEPGDWNTRTNRPSASQRKNIKARIQEVKKRLGGLVTLDDSRIIAFSARRNFQLAQLLNALMAACPKDRRWVLHDRIDLAQYADLVDPRILKGIKTMKKSKPIKK
jgi:predicted GTPase